MNTTLTLKFPIIQENHLGVCEQVSPAARMVLAVHRRGLIQTTEVSAVEAELLLFAPFWLMCRLPGHNNP